MAPFEEGMLAKVKSVAANAMGIGALFWLLSFSFVALGHALVGRIFQAGRRGPLKGRDRR